MNLNQVNLIGRTTRDIELRALPSGAKVASFSLATTRTWNQDGQKKEEATFHNLVAFGKQAEILGQYVKKGQLLFINGRIQNRSWDKDGVKQYRTEIIVENFQLGPKSASTGSTRADREDRGEDTDEPHTDNPDDQVNPDDIPF